MYYTESSFFGFDLFYFVVFYYRTSKQFNNSRHKIKELYKDFAYGKFNLFLTLSKPLIFAQATLHILFIWIPKFNLLSMVNPGSVNDFDDSIILLFITIDLLIVFLLWIMNWNFPGLAIIWLPLNHFNAK